MQQEAGEGEELVARESSFLYPGLPVIEKKRITM